MVDGRIQIRGSENFEETIHVARETLADTGRNIASREMHEALGDLSRRPEPDVTGAIQHSMAALECVARDVTGDPKATLGQILDRHPSLLPPPVDQAVDKLWGFASETGRHLREGREPAMEEAELVVRISAAVATYLGKKATP